jgi:hypothetical protein
MPPYVDETLLAAALVHDAALTLALDASDAAQCQRYLGVAARLGLTLEEQPCRPAILAASPRVVERSGRVRTLVEMIEDQPGDDASRSRLVMLLLRALIWDEADPASNREVIRQKKELIRYQRLLIERRLDDLRRVLALRRKGGS